MLLEGRRALVTGGSTGIGKASAQRLAAEGACVAVNYFSDKEADDAEALARELEAHNAPKAIAVQGDVSKEDDVAAMVQAAVSAFGGLDLLVNNAGIEKQVNLLDMSLDLWNAVLATNLTGVFLCIRAAGPHLIEAGGGTIINISSVHEFIPWPGYGHYCASKGGVKLLMETAARELASDKVRLVNIAPGAIATPINTAVMDDPEQMHAVESEIPLARMGQPEEISAAVAWAASEQASYVTGTTIVVDGGMSLYPKFV